MSRRTTSDALKSALPAAAGGVPIRASDDRLIFGAPIITEEDIEAVVACLRSRWIGRGERASRLEKEFAAYKGVEYAAAVSSGSAAIHLGLLALGIGIGDEVIAPTMTFCATVHSILHTGATPVLVDCDRRTLNIDVTAIEEKITSRTKAIVVVHMCGRCCDMDAVLAIARRHDLLVLEDSAHAIEATHEGRAAGVMGDVGCFSFNVPKNMTTAEGGMVVTSDRKIYERVKLLSLHGMTADAYTRATRGGTYDIVDLGFKYNMTDMAAALGLSQFARLEERWSRREALWREYDAALAGLPVITPAPPDSGSRHGYHLYTPIVLTEDIGASRDEVLMALRAENIGAGVHYVPVHMHQYYKRRFHLKESDYPTASYLGERTISLPFAADMTSRDVADVATALERIIRHYSSRRPAAGRTRSGRRTAGAASRAEVSRPIE